LFWPIRLQLRRSRAIRLHRTSLWLAAMGRVPVPRDVAEIIQGAAARQANTPMVTGSPAEGSAERWSIDGWLFLRPDAELGAANGPRFASYGASQAGAVLRYPA
jgi:hypothetical protein